MEEPKDYFGEKVAATYDGLTGVFEPGAVNATVSLLAELAGGRGALEFGIGTGRIALPLASRGVPVHGIELSRAMVARLRAKPGGDAIGVTVGDFATTRVDRTLSLAYLTRRKRFRGNVTGLAAVSAVLACVGDRPSAGGDGQG